MFLARYVEAHNKTRTFSYQKVKKKKKNMETRLNSIRALNPRPEENLQLYKKLVKKDFWIQVSELVASFSVSSPGFLSSK